VVSDAWPMQNAALYTLLWLVIITAIFAPLSVRQYKRSTLR
jgi:ABC-2 type transport system permease protein